jgi:hypothetical protein
MAKEEETKEEKEFTQDPSRKKLSVDRIVKAIYESINVGPVGTRDAELQKIARVIRGRGKNATPFMQEVAKQFEEDYEYPLRSALSRDFMGDDEDVALNAFGFSTEGSFGSTHQQRHAENNGGIKVPNFEAYGFNGTERNSDNEYDDSDIEKWADDGKNLAEEESYYDKEVDLDEARKEREEEQKEKEKEKAEETKPSESVKPAEPSEQEVPQPTPVESNRIRSRDPKTGPGPRIEQNPITPRKTQPNRSRFEDERVSRILQDDENREILRDARRQRTKDNMYDTLQAVLDSLNSGGDFDGINVDGWSNLDKAKEAFKGITDPDQLDRTQLNQLRKWREFNQKDIPDNAYKGEYRDGYKVGNENQLPSADPDDPRLKKSSNTNNITVPGQGEAGGAIPPEFNSEAEYMRSLMEDPLQGGGAMPTVESPEPQKAKGGDIRSNIEENLKSEPTPERNPNPRNYDGTIPLFGEDGVARDPSGLAFPGQTPSLEDPEPVTGSSDSESFSVDTKPTSDTPGGPRNEYLEPKEQEAVLEPRKQEAVVRYDPDDFELTEDGIIDNRPKGSPDDHILTPSKPFSMDDIEITEDGIIDNRPKESRIQTLPWTREDRERDSGGRGIQTLPYTREDRESDSGGRGVVPAAKPPSMDEIGRELGMIKDPPVGTDTVLRPANQMGDPVTPSKPVTQVPAADSDPTASLPPPPAAPSARDNPYASPTARFDDGYLPPPPEGMEIPDGTQPVYPEGSLTQPEDFPTHSEDIKVAQDITDQLTPDVSPQPAQPKPPSLEQPEPEYYPVQGPIRARDNPNATPEQKMYDDSFTQREMEPRLESARVEGRRRNDEEFAQQDADELERMITGRQLIEPSRYGEGDYKSNLKTDPNDLFTKNEGLVQTGNDGRSTMKVGGSKQQMMPVYGANGLIGYKPIDPALTKKSQEGTLTKADRVQFDNPMAGGAATDALRLQDAYRNSKSATPHLDMRQDQLRMSRMGQAEKDQYYRERMAKLHGVGVHGSELEQNMRNPNYNPLSTAEMPSVNFDNLQETGRMLQADRMHPGHNLRTPEQQVEEDLARRGVYRPGSARDLRTLGFSDPDITMMKQNELRQKNKKQDSPRILNSFV